ncbi:unnamed protein product [Rhizophagus irregularis]|nr:unnamed protein product [Rhizophagus irregularis]
MFEKCWATSIIRERYIPEWSSTPPLKWTPISQRRYGNTDLNMFSHEISELLKIKAIQEMDLKEPCFVSNLFMVPKKDGSDRPCKIASTTRRFYGFNRSQPSLLSRSCVDWIKKVLYLRFYGKTILFQLFTLWVYSQSKDIYKNSATDNKVSTEQRDLSSGILGRYSDNCINQEIGSNTRTIYDFLSSKSGILDRFQVYDDKITEIQDQRFNTRMQKDKPKASNSDAKLEWYYRTFPGKHRTIGEPTSIERTKSYSRKTKDNLIHRRFDLQMGHVLGGLCNTWKMAKNGTASSHQHSRVKSDFVRSTSFQGFKGPTDYDTHRQYNMRCLHKSSGRNDIYFTVKDSGEAIDIEDQLVQDVQSNLGTTSYRPLCKSPQYTTDKVLFLDTGSRSRGSECLSSELGTHEFVGQFSIDTYSENISQSNQKQGHDKYISTLLDVSTVVSTVVRPFDCPADFNSFNQYYGSRYESSSEEPNVRLQNFRIRYQEKGFSKKTIELLLASLDQNSTRSISSNLRVWLRWCESRNLDPITCDLNSICEFFNDKLKDGKAANTIAGYCTAISEVHELVNGQSVESHPDISRAILAVHRLNPPTIKQNDNLDISSSLEYILSLGDNDSMSFRQLTVKTAFLIALVTASRPSDIIRMDLTTLQATDNSYSFDCVAPKEYNIASAHSTATIKRRIKRIFIGSYSDNLLLCPFLTLKVFLSKIEHFRTTLKQKRSIFLITKQPYSLAAVDTIAGWIKSVIQISSPASTAKMFALRQHLWHKMQAWIYQQF